MRHCHGALRGAGSAVVIGAIFIGATPAYASTSTQTPVAPTGFYGGFSDVTAVSATDGWAVGGNGNGLVQRFNGASWSIAASPDLLDGGANTWAILSGVDSVSASSAFAVGRATGAGNTGQSAVALRWNGSAWSRLAVPRPAGTDTSLAAVKAFSPSDVWANTTAAPPLATLSSVTARSSNDVWVAGADANGTPALAHWTGAGWSVTPVSVTGGVGLPSLAQVTVVDAATEWAVGSQWDGATGQSSAIAFRVVG